MNHKTRHRGNPTGTIASYVVMLMLVTNGSADVELPAVISDNMVLQQRMNAPVWGWAEPGEKVSVKGGWQDSGVLTKADTNGKWMVTLRTPKPGGPFEITIKGENTITLGNVLVGEVWVCSGQSNMAMPVKRAANAAREIATAGYPKIRLFAAEKPSAAERPQRNCKGRWLLCSPQTVPDFSAAGYFYGRELHAKLNVPIGLIDGSRGSTSAEAWMRRRALEADPIYEPIVRRLKKQLKHFPQMREEYRQKLIAWEQAVGKARREGTEAPQGPHAPLGPGEACTPTGMYNAMIAPVIPYGIRGVIWYQGEGNANRAYLYRRLFPALIRNWRDGWGQGDFPFYYVQIAPWNRYHPFTAAELRESQLLSLSVPNTGMAVTMDVPDVTNLHPRNKQDVGRRLALLAFAKTYGHKGVVYSGPMYNSMKREGERIRLSFDYVAGGLVAKDGELKCFAIAGKDKRFVSARAMIDGDTIVVHSDEVKNPVAVRFAWSNAALPNLYNKGGLPASPFRTDGWPCVTVNSNY